MVNMAVAEMQAELRQEQAAAFLFARTVEEWNQKTLAWSEETAFQASQLQEQMEQAGQVFRYDS